MRLVKVLLAAAILIPFAWMFHFACKPQCWKTLVWLADTLLPPSCEWPHDIYIKTLSFKGWLERIVFQPLEQGAYRG